MVEESRKPFQVPISELKCNTCITVPCLHGNMCWRGQRRATRRYAAEMEVPTGSTNCFCKGTNTAPQTNLILLSHECVRSIMHTRATSAAWNDCESRCNPTPFRPTAALMLKSSLSSSPFIWQLFQKDSSLIYCFYIINMLFIFNAL